MSRSRTSPRALALIAAVAAATAACTPFPEHFRASDPTIGEAPPDVLYIYHNPTRYFCAVTAGDIWRFHQNVCDESVDRVNRRGLDRGSDLRGALDLPDPTPRLAEKLAAALRADPSFAGTDIRVVPFDSVRGCPDCLPDYYLRVFPKTWHLWPEVLAQRQLHMAYDAVLAVGQPHTSHLPWRSDCGLPRTGSLRLADWTAEGGRRLLAETDNLLDLCAHRFAEKVVRRSSGWPTLWRPAGATRSP